MFWLGGVEPCPNRRLETRPIIAGRVSRARHGRQGAADASTALASSPLAARRAPKTGPPSRTPTESRAQAGAPVAFEQGPLTGARPESPAAGDGRSPARRGPSLSAQHLKRPAGPTWPHRRVERSSRSRPPQGAGAGARLRWRKTAPGPPERGRSPRRHTARTPWPPPCSALGKSRTRRRPKPSAARCPQTPPPRAAGSPVAQTTGSANAGGSGSRAAAGQAPRRGNVETQQDDDVSAPGCQRS